MAWHIHPVSAPVHWALARYLRQQAEECLRLSNSIAGQDAVAANELVIMAASLHERALRLESGSQQRTTTHQAV
jgi:hypothetical protein